MTLRLFGCLLIALPAVGQPFRDLATTTTGEVAYFASTLRMTGTDQFLYSKIYAADRQGVRLIAQEDRSVEMAPPPTPFSLITNYYQLSRPRVSGDGSVVGYQGTRECMNNSARCGSDDPPRFTLLVPPAPITISGPALMSRNGKFVVAFFQNSLQAYSYRANLDGSDLVQLPSTAVYGVTNNGSVLLKASGSLAIFDGTLRPLKPTSFAGAIIDDAATTVIYNSGGLHAINLADQKEWSIGPTTATSPSISSDGNKVLFLAPFNGQTQVFLSTRDGVSVRLLTALKEGVREAVLSGDGRYAFAFTTLNSLIRVDTASGETEQWFLPPPVLTLPVNTLGVGSTYTATGSGLSRLLRLDGLQALIVVSEEGRVDFEVPNDFPLDPSADPFAGRPVVLSVAGRDYFEYASFVQVAKFAPRAVPLSLDGSIAIHADFGGLVTVQNPARPGETLNLYMDGLGPVTPDVSRDRPAPTSPLSRTITAWGFVVSDSLPERAAEVLFEGLAPGLTGYYQVALRFPSDVRGMARLTIVGEGVSLLLGSIPVTP